MKPSPYTDRYSSSPPQIIGHGDAADVRTGWQADAVQQAILDHLRYSIGRPASVLTPGHYYRALALAVHDRVQQGWIASTQTFVDLSRKAVCTCRPSS